MDLEFRHLTFISTEWYGFKQKSKTILNDINGKFRFGELSAILGPSGSGKTSLLKSISGYHANGITAEFKLNNSPQSYIDLRKKSCYLAQEDSVAPYVTVMELMTFAANLKLPHQITKAKKLQIIDSALNDLGLLNQKQTATKRLSGGERKRLSIALELINNPAILILDEPTSGLDDVSSKDCIQVLKDLAHKGHTIICTIHQPSTSLFELFDYAYILARGHCVYQGTVDSIVLFLRSLGLECPLNYTPIDFLIEIIDCDAAINNNDNNFVEMLSNFIQNGNLECKHVQTKKSSSELESVAEHSCYLEHIFENKNNDQVVLLTAKKRTQIFHDTKISYPINKFNQFLILLERMGLLLLRNKFGLALLLFHYVFCSISIGLLFYNNGNNGSAMFEHMKLFIGITTFFSYTHAMVPILSFPTELKQIENEIFNRWYSLLPYYLALTFSKLPLQIILNMYFNATIYFMIGYPKELFRFASFSLINILISLNAESIGLAIGSFATQTNGVAIGPAILGLNIGISAYGFDFMTQIPWYVEVIMKMTFMRCGIVCLVLTMFSYDRARLDCADDFCLFDQPKALLKYLDAETRPMWPEFIALIILLIFFRTITYFIIRHRVSK